MKISYKFKKVYFIKEMNQKTTFGWVCQLWN